MNGPDDLTPEDLGDVVRHVNRTRSRIRHILAAWPVSTWSLEETQSVLAALEKIARGRLTSRVGQ